MHDNPFIASTAAEMHKQGTTFICYHLPPGDCGALKDMCCNGMRYGYDGDYISFPHLNINTINKVLT